MGKLSALLALVLFVLVCPLAQADKSDLSIEQLTLNASDPTPGAHSDFVLEAQTNDPPPDENKFVPVVTKLRIDFPPGLSGYLTRPATECHRTEVSHYERCPVESQIGDIYIKYHRRDAKKGIDAYYTGTGHVYNLGITKSPGHSCNNKDNDVETMVVACTGIALRMDGLEGPPCCAYATHRITLEGSDKSSSYHLVDSGKNPSANPIVTFKLTLYSHTHQVCVADSTCPPVTPVAPSFDWDLFAEPLTVPDLTQPLNRNPTACRDLNGALQFVSVRNGAWFTSGKDAPLSLDQTKCKPDSNPNIAFGPQLEVKSGKQEAPDEPSPYDVTLDFPQEQVGKQNYADLRTAKVELPKEVTLSPSAADGLGGVVECTPQQFKLDDLNAAPECPSRSQIGTVEARVPTLPTTITGNVYLAPIEAAHNNYPVYVDVADYGFHIKFVGNTNANPDTGQLTSVFSDLPPLPQTQFTMHYRGGRDADGNNDPERSVLANPFNCGDHTADAVFSPWSDGPDASAASAFPIGPLCLSAFNPQIAVSQNSNKAGQSTTSELRINRDPPQQHIRKMKVSLPAGVVANLKDIPACSKDQALRASCDESTRVGSVTTTVGTGSKPVTLTGKVYLTGRDGPDPSGLSIVVPAKVGSLDLGNVVIPAQIKVRADLGVDVVAEVPRTVHGIPAVLRWMSLDVDRPGFLYNPTNCSQKSVVGHFSSDTTDSTSQAVVQAEGCSDLPFNPHLSATASGDVSQGAHPAVTTVVTQQGLGEAALSQVQVTLPTTLAPDLKAIDRACPADKLKADQCPQTSIIGTAKAETPILPEPLTGNVYVTRIPGQTLPGVAVRLKGMVNADLDGVTSFGSQSALVTTFSDAPDAPVTSFQLNFFGGSAGIIAAAKDLCSNQGNITGQFTGQNGATYSEAPALQVDRGCKVQTAKVCTRKLKLKLPTTYHHARLPTGGAKIKLYVNGKKRKVKLSHKRTISLKLHGGSGTKSKVKLVIDPKHGKKITITKKYASCVTKSKKRQRSHRGSSKHASHRSHKSPKHRSSRSN